MNPRLRNLSEHTTPYVLRAYALLESVLRAQSHAERTAAEDKLARHLQHPTAFDYKAAQSGERDE